MFILSDDEVKMIKIKGLYLAKLHLALRRCTRVLAEEEIVLIGHSSEILR